MNHRLLASAIAIVLASTVACSGGDGDDAEIESVDSDGERSAETTTTAAGTDAPADAEPGADAAAEEAPVPLVLVMDASGSMNRTTAGGETLLDGAKQALSDVVRNLPDGTPTGLVLYGHRVPNTDEARGCRDIELVQPVEPLDRDALLATIDGYEAQGFTPIAGSLQEAARALPPEGERTIVLVSDGEETCAPPDACDVAEELRADGIELVINTVGFALGDNDQARTELECIAEAGGGQFHDVDNAADLADTLADVSVRERRQAELTGSALEGAPLPRDANTGETNTSYTDTVLANEENFYRFEIDAGSEVTGEVIVTYAGGEDCHGGGRFAEAWLTNAGDSPHDINSGAFPEPGGTATVIHTLPEEIDDDEVFLKVDTTRCDFPTAEFDVEFQVTVE